MDPTGTSTPTHSSAVFTGSKSRKRFISYRLRGEYEKPWLQDPKFNRTKYNNWIVCVWVFIGVCAAAVVAYFNVKPAIAGPVRPRSPPSPQPVYVVQMLTFADMPSV